jgi:hypothetical protein
MVLRAVLRHARDIALRWLQEELAASDQERLAAVLRFIRGERVTELVPDLLRRVRELPPPERPPVYAALADLRVPGTEALLLAELVPSARPDLRSAAATTLLDLGGGERRLSELIAEGDGAVLHALLLRARMAGEEGVPRGLVPAVLEAVRRMPGEDGRRAALFVLRFRGRFEDDVRQGLLDAYVHEPSRRVAADIAEAIEELAYR